MANFLFNSTFAVALPGKKEGVREPKTVIIYGDGRLIVLNKKGKADWSCMISAIRNIHSPNPDFALISTDDNKITFHLQDKQSELELDLLCFHILTILNDCAVLSDSLIQVKFGQARAEWLSSVLSPTYPLTYLKGFTDMYPMVCASSGLEVRRALTWDLDTIFTAHNTKHMDIIDLLQIYDKSGKDVNLKDVYPFLVTLKHNSWFTSLTFANVRLCAESMILMGDILRVNTSLEEVTISSLLQSKCEPLFDRLAAGLTERTTPHCLKRLNITHLPLDTEKNALPALASVLKSAPPLQKISLANCQILAKHIVKLSECFEPHTMSLTYLDLSSNNLRAGAESCAILNEIAQCGNLESLILSRTELNVDGLFQNMMNHMVSIPLAFSKLANLDLSDNPLGFAVSKKSSNFGAKLGNFFTKSLPCLKNINLSYNKLSSHMINLIFTTISVNSSLRRDFPEISLNLCGNELQKSGCVEDLIAVISSLKKSANIKSLDLSENGLDSDLVRTSGIILQHALTFPGTFENLNLSGNSVKLQSTSLFSPSPVANSQNLCSVINQYFLKSVQITKLTLADCKIKPDIQELFSGLVDNPILRELDISGNALSDSVVRYLCTCLQVNWSLKTLSLDRNPLTPASLSELNLMLDKNRSLTAIDLPLQEIFTSPSANKQSGHISSLVHSIQRKLLRNSKISKDDGDDSNFNGGLPAFDDSLHRRTASIDDAYKPLRSSVLECRQALDKALQSEEFPVASKKCTEELLNEVNTKTNALADILNPWCGDDVTDVVGVTPHDDDYSPFEREIFDSVCGKNSSGIDDVVDQFLAGSSAALDSMRLKAETCSPLIGKNSVSWEVDS